MTKKAVEILKNNPYYKITEEDFNLDQKIFMKKWNLVYGAISNEELAKEITGYKSYEAFNKFWGWE